MESSHELLRPIDLRGVKVWLSGAVPEPRTKPDEEQIVEIWTGSDAEIGILAFVQIFSALVFKYGGEVVHGCHPSFTPILLQQSRRHLKDQAKEPSLKLFASDYFSSEQSQQDWDRWRRFASVNVTEKTGSKEKDRDPSLRILRSEMANQCSAFVAIGGKWWDDIPARAGVPIEFGLAKEVGVPCFVLGGFGGIASEYARQNPDWYNGLGNKLSVEDNQFLANNTNFSLVAGLIIAQLNQFADGENTAEAQAAN